MLLPWHKAWQPRCGVYLAHGGPPATVAISAISASAGHVWFRELPG